MCGTVNLRHAVANVLDCGKHFKQMLHADADSDDPSESEMDWREDWDHDCSWRPWAVHPDPIGEYKGCLTEQHFIVICCSLGSSGDPNHSRAGHLELDLVWENISAAAAAHGQATKPASASHWRVHVLDPAQAPSHGHRLFSLKVGAVVKSQSATKTG